MEFLELNSADEKSRVIKKVLEFIKNNPLDALPLGRQSLGGEDFVNVFEYETDEPSQKIWEAHRKFIDVHCVISGIERVNQAFLKNCEAGDFVAEKDFLPIQNPPKQIDASVILEPNKLLVFYPNDAHQTGVWLKKGEKIKIKKAVFKLVSNE